MAAKRPEGARRAALPGTLLPQLATPSASAPRGGEWLYELKFDGYRLLARCSKAGVRLHTRSGADWTAKLPDLARAVEALRLGEAWLDGEIVVLGPTGVPSFQRLQNAFDARRTAAIRYYAFDLPFHGGLDLRDVRQDERRALLAKLLPATGAGPVLFSEAFDAPVESLFASACKMGLEGLIAKRADAPYTASRSRAWLKLKCKTRQEFVIGGFTQPQGSRSGFGALLLGVYDDGQLRYAGRVGTGFDDRAIVRLHAQLEALATATIPFVNPPTGVAARGVTWVKPRLVGEVEFAEWTEEGLVRHAAFRGVRTDKPAKEIRREAAPAALQSPAKPAPRRPSKNTITAMPRAARSRT